METPLGPRTVAPARAPAGTQAARSKPDARPMRFALGAGGLAAMSALAAGIVMPPSAATVAPADVAAAPQSVAAAGAPAATLQVKRPVTYIQLAPGQTPPPGAQVIAATAPKPITIVTTIPAPKQAPQKVVIIKTTQSGKVVK